MNLKRQLTCRVNVGRFIGPRGQNIRNLQKRTGTMIYKDHGIGEVGWYSTRDESALNAVRRAMGHT